MSAGVRPMAIEDVARCAEIVDGLAFFQDYGLTGDAVSALLSDALRDSGHTLVVGVEAGRVQGFAWIVDRGAFCRSAYLRLIATCQASRRGGVGSRLMAHLERMFLAEADLTLLVTESNAPARRFYEKLGYQQVGALPDYVRTGVTECLYIKPRHR